MEHPLQQIVQQINGIIQAQEWFDFHVVEYDAKHLIIGGGQDLSYSHNLEVIFEDVFFYSGVINEWHTDTSKPALEMPDGEKVVQLNKRFEIQQGYQLFIIRTEDLQSDIHIAAKKLSYNTDTVFYYLRPDLKENERIADFVKKQ